MNKLKQREEPLQDTHPEQTGRQELTSEDESNVMQYESISPSKPSPLTLEKLVC